MSTVRCCPSSRQTGASFPARGDPAFSPASGVARDPRAEPAREPIEEGLMHFYRTRGTMAAVAAGAFAASIVGAPRAAAVLRKPTGDADASITPVNVTTGTFTQTQREALQPLVPAAKPVQRHKKPVGHNASHRAEPVHAQLAVSAASTTEAAVAPSRRPREIARALLRRDGFAASQWACLNALWTRESGWSVTETNDRSGAYGIPQALPGSKMERAGPDWRTNPATQISLGLHYIRARYGTPCAAWHHSQRYNFY
jgi:ribosomal protein S18 acetylase RimI-like enzyme